MKKKTLLTVATSTLVSILAVSGVAYAASIDATSKLGGSSGDDFEFDGTGRFNSVVIGKQGVGGVTFFNGTMVNNTTTEGNDNPITIGDNVRIDGRVYRGETAGSEDSLPFIINDNLKVEGSIEMDPATRYEHVTRFDIVPSDEPQDYAISTADGFYNEDGANSFYFAPVDLPNGATLKNITSLYKDESVVNDMTVKLWSIKLSDNTFSELATFDTTTGESAFSADVNLMIDLENYAYVMSYEFNGNTDNALAAKETRLTYTVDMP